MARRGDAGIETVRAENEPERAATSRSKRPVNCREREREGERVRRGECEGGSESSSMTSEP